MASANDTRRSNNSDQRSQENKSKTPPSATYHEDKKSLFNEVETNALITLHNDLLKIKKDDINEIVNVIQKHFWPKNPANVLPLFDAINKAHPKLKTKMAGDRENQAHQLPKLRYSQADFIYCLAFIIPGQSDYLLGKVGMSATAGTFKTDLGVTVSRFEELRDIYISQFKNSNFGTMELVKHQPTFKLYISPDDSSNVQNIETKTRNALGWSVEKNIMKALGIGVPTEWIIIPKTQSDHLYNKVKTLRSSEAFEMIDTRVLKNLPTLEPKPHITFKWTSSISDKPVEFSPFGENMPTSSPTIVPQNEPSRNSTEKSTHSENGAAAQLKFKTNESIKGNERIISNSSRK